jgi:F-type H+-transporting ATPase subunit a
VLKKLFTVRNLVILLAVIALFVVSGLLGLKVPPPHVVLAAEPLFHIGGFTVTNALFTTWIVMIILVVVALVTTGSYPKDLAGAKNGDLVPTGWLGNFMEWVIEGLYGFSESVAGKWVVKFFPIVMTIFLFIVLSNWLSLIPGVGTIGMFAHPESAAAHGYVARGIIMTAEQAKQGEGVVLIPFLRPPATDLNFTVALALVAVFMAQFFGVSSQKLNYFKKFIDLSGFKQGAFMGLIQVFVGLLELVSEFARIISFSFRLFGNVFAGEVLLLVLAFLIPYVVSLPFYALEGFVGFIQGFVFFMLALVFFTLATQGHHGEEEHH